MKIHRNAETNVYQRRLLITRVRRQGWTQRRAAEAAGVSVRTVAKWRVYKFRTTRGRVVTTSRRPFCQSRGFWVTLL